MSVIRKPSQLTVKSIIKVLIYGQPGLGKTTTGLSAPAPLLLDFDGGVHRVNPIHQTDTVQIESWNDVLSLMKEDLSPYKTLVLDTAGKMLDFMGAHLIKNNPKLGKSNGALSLQGYGERKAEFNNFLKQAELLGKHLVFIAHEKEEKNGDEKIIRPEIGGSSGADLIKDLDLVGYMEASGKKRTISFDPCEKFYGKNTCQLPTLIEMPNLNTGSPNISLSSIFVSYQESLEKRKEIGVQYDVLMASIKETVESAIDAKTINALVKKAQEETNVIWDSNLQTKLLINAKAKDLGLSFNKTSNSYEAKPVATATV